MLKDNSYWEEEKPVEEVIGRDPDWMVRSGQGLLLLCFLILFTVIYIVKYPDTIRASTILTTQVQPAVIKSKRDGRLLHLNISDGEHVEKGKLLAVMESSVDFNDIIRLFKIIEEIEVLHLQDKLISFNVKNITSINLGALQEELNDLLLSLIDLQANYGSTKLNELTSSTKVLTSSYKNIITNLEQKKSLWNERLKIDSVRNDKKKMLFTDGAISNEELYVVNDQLYEKQINVQDINLEISLYSMKVDELEQKLFSYKTDLQEKSSTLKSRVFSSLSALSGAISIWKEVNLIRSPISGTVSFSNLMKENQNLLSHDTLATVFNKKSKVIAIATIEEFGSGRVSTSNKVKIYLDSFPSQEYGEIYGYIKNLSLVPINGQYVATIELENELNTSTGSVIPFRPNTKGTALIITKERRLFERLLDKLIYTINRNQ